MSTLKNIIQKCSTRLTHTYMHTTETLQNNLPFYLFSPPGCEQDGSESGGWQEDDLYPGDWGPGHQDG